MIRDEIRKAATAALCKNLSRKDLPDFITETPEDGRYGDYALNLAGIAKKTGADPTIYAGKIAEILRSKSWDTEARGAFVNFKLHSETLYRELGRVLSEREKYGHLDAPRPSKKINIEFISANPTGPLTLANGRGGFLGDALANIFEARGYGVEREYYVNDTGNQIIVLGESLLAAANLIPEEDKFYQGNYIKDWTGDHKNVVQKHADNPLKLGQLAAKDFFKDIKKTLKKSGIRFNRFTSEDKHIHKKSFVEKALKIFKSRKLTYEKDGALWLKTAQFGDDKDRVLITSDGFPTYFLADSGHYLETKTRGFDRKINILGPDHFGYVQRIQAAAHIIGFNNSEVIVTQAVRLMERGKEVKMSKRLGQFVTLEELIEKIGQDAARYFFLEKSPDTHMDFDLDLAKERSVKNPVYYVQYAHARMASIFRKAKNGNSKLQTPNSKSFKLLTAKEELDLLKKLIRFPEVIEDTSRDYRIHRLTRYAYELARAFHNFYEKHRVITDDQELTRARLALVRAAQTVLQNSLKIMGISAPEKM